jgi:hypothetical protein
MSNEFICHDWAGWNEQYGRYTHMPSGATLRCEGWMKQHDWDAAQLEWLKKYDGSLVVHKCPRGPYRETGDTMGTVAEITERLSRRLSPA